VFHGISQKKIGVGRRKKYQCEEKTADAAKRTAQFVLWDGGIRLAGKYATYVHCSTVNS